MTKNLKNTYEDYILPDLEAEAKNRGIPIFGLGSKRFNGIELPEPLEVDHSVKTRS